MVVPIRLAKRTCRGLLTGTRANLTSPVRLRARGGRERGACARAPELHPRQPVEHGEQRQYRHEDERRGSAEPLRKDLWLTEKERTGGDECREAQAPQVPPDA